MTRLIKKAIVWTLAASCAALDNIPRFGRAYKPNPDLGTRDIPYEEYIVPDGWKLMRRGQWGCWIFGGNLALWSVRLEERWHTGVWEVITP